MTSKPPSVLPAARESRSQQPGPFATTSVEIGSSPSVSVVK